ncbi:MAG: hypothetical protein WBA91_05440 [Paracoccaceae bacterium]
MVEFVLSLQPLAGPVHQSKVTKPVDPVTVAASGGAGGSRNDTDWQRPRQTPQSPTGKIEPLPDPDPPTGPPPTFEANVLEAQEQRERLQKEAAAAGPAAKAGAGDEEAERASYAADAPLARRAVHPAGGQDGWAIVAASSAASDAGPATDLQL